MITNPRSKSCECKACALEDKIMDALDGQETSDGLPALVSSLAQVLVQHAGGDVMQLKAHIEHATERLAHFCAVQFTEQSRQSNKEPFAWLKAIIDKGGLSAPSNDAFKEDFDLAKLPPEIRDIIEQAKKAGAEVHVVASKVKH